MKIIIFLFFTLYAFGCVFPASKEGMVVRNYMVPKQTGEKIFVKESTGGSETLPFWESKISNENFTEAVKESLLNSKAFSALSTNWGDDWGLEIEIRDVNQPKFGLDFTVTTDIKYALYLKGKKVHETTISEQGTATFSDAFLGFKRLRIANEYSARTNVKKFIEELSNPLKAEDGKKTKNILEEKKGEDKIHPSNILSVNLSHTLIVGGLDVGFEHVLRENSTIGLRTVWLNGSLPGKKEESTIEGMSLSTTYKYYLNKNNIEGVWIGPNLSIKSTIQKFKKTSGCEVEFSETSVGPAVGYSWLFQNRVIFSVVSIYQFSETKNNISDNCQGKVSINKINPLAWETGIGFLF